MLSSVLFCGIILILLLPTTAIFTSTFDPTVQTPANMFTSRISFMQPHTRPH